MPRTSQPPLRNRFWVWGLALAAAAMSCASPCQNEIISEVESPNGSLKAVVFQRDCGAASGFSTQVSILEPAEALADAGGNIFTVDDDHGRATSGPGGGPKVLVRWVSNHEIEIASDPNGRVFLKEIAYRSVMIRHVSIPAHGP